MIKNVIIPEKSPQNLFEIQKNFNQEEKSTPNWIGQGTKDKNQSN